MNQHLNDHQHYEDRLPLYAAGQLEKLERAEIERHLHTCAGCRADLDLWRAVGTEITAISGEIQVSPRLAERALRRLHAPSPLRRAFLQAASLLHAQAYLVRREMWPASAILMAISTLVTYLSGKLEFVYFIAPLVAAAGLAAIYGPEHDPASELTLATPTSPWKVLLARLTLVHAYNLFLALAASLFLLLLIPPDLLGTLILSWLGPMTFLSALALLLSLWIGTSNSIAIAYGLWLVQFPRYELAVDPATTAAWMPILHAYRQFWGSPLLLVGLGLLLLVIALGSVGRAAPQQICVQI
jgi:anti-sigma factor RsiW